MESQTDKIAFEMNALRINLPQKRGLSMYYSGKSRSFTCMNEVHCLEDLKKQEHPFNCARKRRKKYLDRKAYPQMPPPPYPGRRIASSTSTQCQCQSQSQSQCQCRPLCLGGV